MEISQEKLTVYRKGNTFRVRSSWSKTEDLVIVICLGNESCWIVPKGSDIRRCTEHLKLHVSTDDFPAILFGGYGYLSGNHGSCFARRIITGRGNEFTEADLGRLLLDNQGNRFRIMETKDLCSILIHPENTGTAGHPIFADYQGQPLFYEDGTSLYVEKWTKVQMYPLNRIVKQEFLLNGKYPLPENRITECFFLEHRVIHEVVSPGDVVQWVASHPGKMTCPAFRDQWRMVFDDGSAEYKEYRNLPTLIHAEATFTYQPNGVQVTDRTVTCKTELDSVSCLEQMFGWGGIINPADAQGNYLQDAVEEMYIPKLKKLNLMCSDKKQHSIDFSNIASTLPPYDTDYLIKASDALDQKNLPDRFIRLTGRGKRQYGVVLGYSLINGCTAIGEKSVPRPFLYNLVSFRKMYPNAYCLEHTIPGQQVRCVSYKQYFNPANNPDFTDFYIHREGQSYVVYMDCHKSLSRKRVIFPAYLTGKRITVLEKTSSVSFTAPKNLPKEGLLLDVSGNHGSLVLKLD